MKLSDAYERLGYQVVDRDDGKAVVKRKTKRGVSYTVINDVDIPDGEVIDICGHFVIYPDYILHVNKNIRYFPIANTKVYLSEEIPESIRNEIANKITNNEPIDDIVKHILTARDIASWGDVAELLNNRSWTYIVVFATQLSNILIATATEDGSTEVLTID